MKVTIERNRLLDAVQTALRAVNPHAMLRILSHVLIKAEADTLTFVGNDLELYISKSVKNDAIEEPGELAVPAKLLNDIVSALPAGPVVMQTLEGGKLQITGGKAKYDVFTLPAEEFPQMTDAKVTTELTVDAQAFKQSLNRVVFATATDESKPSLTAVHVKNTEGKLELAATDIYRLAVATCEYVELSDDVELLIPKRGVAEIVRLIDGAEGALKVSVLGNVALAIELPDVFFITRLIEATYVDYGKLVSDRYTRRVVVDKAEFTSAVQRADVVAKERSHMLYVTVRGVQDDGLGVFTIKAEHTNVGKAHEELAVEVDGDDAAVDYESRYNAKSLLDFMSAVTATHVEILTGGNPFVTLRIPENDSYRYIMAPMVEA